MDGDTPRNLQLAGRLITWAATQHGDRPSLVVRDQVYSHRDLERRSNRLAHALVGLGLRPGERVGVLLENSVHSLDTVFALEKAALTSVALNARHTAAEHLDILADAQASAVIVGPPFAPMAEAFAAAGQQLPELRLVLGWGETAPLDLQALCEAAPETPPGLQVAPDHVQRIAYTSGTTGRPKGVAYTVERWQTRLANHFMAMEYGLSVDDTMLHAGPLTHAAGVHLLPCFLRGARNVVLERFDPLALLEAIERHRVTQLMLVPTMMSRLVDAIEAGARADWSSLRRIHYGTAPTPAGLIRRALAIFGPILRQQYGMTEAVQPLAVLYPHEHLEDGDTRRGVDGWTDDPIASCGKPSANVRITLRDEHGREVARGEVGEIAVAHEGIGRVQFWRRPDLMAQSVRDGWYYTGDLGRFDANGFLHIVGRNKDMIISGGFNVYAREVEDALAAHEAVAEVAVLGLPDPEWGEVVAAAVVLRAGATTTTDDLAAFLAQRLAGYKKPRRWMVIPALPRNLAGKVVKPELKQRFGQAEGSTGGR